MFDLFTLKIKLVSNTKTASIGVEKTNTNDGRTSKDSEYCYAKK